MHGMHSILVLAVLATFALAAPTPKHSLSKRSFTVPRIRRPGYVRDPVHAMARAYRKYGWQRTNDDGLPWVVVSSEGSDTTAITSSELGDLFSSLGDASDSDSSLSTAFGFESSSSTVPEVASATTVSSSTSSVLPSSSNVVSTADKAATSTYASSLPSSSTASASTDVPEETGEVSATPAESGAEYISPVTIGGQKLNLDFDTGSSDLWVFSAALSASEIGQHQYYDPSKSSNFQKMDGYTFSLSYGDGSGAAGTVGTDTVDIGGATVTRQAIEMATSVSSAFVEDTSSDGLVGLAFSSLNSISPKSQNTFFENVMSELAQPVFTADLDVDGSGTYEFGTIDASKFSGNLMFTPVDSSSGFWQFDSTSYKIGNKTIPRSSASPAIADTGTSLLLLDPEVVTAYYGEVSSAVYDKTTGGYVYDCSEDLPDFGVAVGDGYMAGIPGTGITFAAVNSTTCFGGIQSNSGSKMQIFGDALLKYHFVVFNGKNEVLGMAAKA